MRDVLGTIQADQDAIIRAGSRGALVVDGGPGTGKTVVALHRTAYLLYSDPRLGHRRGGVLFVGPHQPYLAYVADVLPSLGEEGVQTCTLRDLVPEGDTAAEETDPEVARLKASAALVAAVDAAVRLLRGPAHRGVDRRDRRGSTPGSARGTGPRRSTRREPGTPHNEAREQILGGDRRSCVDKQEEAEDDAVPEQVAESLRRNRELLDGPRPGLAAHRADRPGRRPVVGARLPAAVCSVARAATRCGRCSALDPLAWTVADLPLLDAARHRLGDPTRHDASASTQRRSRPSARRWAGSSTTSCRRRPREAGDVDAAGPGPAERHRRPVGAARRPTRTCWPDRSRTSWSTRRRS